jgi:hypothetical protein
MKGIVSDFPHLCREGTAQSKRDGVKAVPFTFKPMGISAVSRFNQTKRTIFPAEKNV